MLGTKLTLGSESALVFNIGHEIDLILHAPPNGDAIVLYSIILDLPDNKERRADIFERAMQMNLLHEQMSGGALSLDARSNQLYWSRTLPLSWFDHEQILKALLDAADVVQNLHYDWHQSLQLANRIYKH